MTSLRRHKKTQKERDRCSMQDMEERRRAQAERNRLDLIEQQEHEEREERVRHRIGSAVDFFNPATHHLPKVSKILWAANCRISRLPGDRDINTRDVLEYLGKT